MIGFLIKTVGETKLAQTMIFVAAFCLNETTPILKAISLRDLLPALFGVIKVFP